MGANAEVTQLMSRDQTVLRGTQPFLQVLHRSSEPVGLGAEHHRHGLPGVSSALGSLAEVVQVLITQLVGARFLRRCERTRNPTQAVSNPATKLTSGRQGSPLGHR